MWRSAHAAGYSITPLEAGDKRKGWIRSVNSECVFFYGTLLPGLAPAHLGATLNRLTPRGEARVAGRLYDFGDYPGAILDAASGDEIVGRLFSIPDNSALEELDAYEGFQPGSDGSLFVRTETQAVTQSGSVFHCWIYVYNRDPGNAPRVPNGDYARLVASRRL